MNTITVTNKEDFEKAVNEQADKIIITGDFAKSIISTQKKKNVSKKVGIGSLITGGLVLVAGVAAAPFTGGYKCRCSPRSISIDNCRCCYFKYRRISNCGLWCIRGTGYFSRYY